MAGVKGRSGRKTRYQEVQDGNLEKVCTKYILENFETFDDKTKLKIALQIASKGITQKTDSNINLREERNDVIVSEVQKYINRLN